MKTRIALLLLLIIGTVACHRKVCGFFSYRPQSSELTTIPVNLTDSISGIEHTDSMFLRLLFTGENVECATFQPLSFGGEAMAFDRHNYAWQSRITSFHITSDHDFNEILAGNSLNDKLWGFANSFTKLSVTDALAPFMDKNSPVIYNYNNISFQFKEKPQEPIHTFTATLQLADGRVLKATAEQVEWK